MNDLLLIVIIGFSSSIFFIFLYEFIKWIFRLNNPKCNACNVRSYSQPIEFFCGTCGNRDFTKEIESQ